MFEKSSTFEGFLQDPELKFMAIDYFEEPTRSCCIFLVSHNHSDHTKGLKNFVDILNKSNDKFIYTSPLTAEFLKNSFSIQPDKIISLPINKSTIVYELESTYVCVTCLPAAHCPGSVMFLIEYNDKKILYTGDFRMNLNYFKTSQKYLINDDGSFKGIDDLYLDSTFALPSDFDHFPAREDSEKLILNMVEEWILKSENHKIVIEIPACIGTEYLFFAIVKSIKSRIIVHDSSYYRFYSTVEEMSSYIESVDDILQRKDWKVHACRGSTCIHRLTGQRNFQVKVIKPCALSFFQGYYDKNLCWKYDVPYTAYKKYGGVDSVKVFYSSHSSLKELQEIVEFVKPKNIFFNTKYDEAVDLMYSLFKIKLNNENSVPVNVSECDTDKAELASSKDYLEFQQQKEQIYNKLKLF